MSGFTARPYEYEHNSTYAFSENKVVAYRELEGLEASLAVGDIWQAAANEAAAFFRGLDNLFSFNTRNSISRSDAPKAGPVTVNNSVTVTNKTETSGNLEASFKNIVRNGSNKNNTEPMVKTVKSTTVTKEMEVKVDVKGVSGSLKTIVDPANKKTTTEGTMSTQRGGLDYGSTVSSSSDGTKGIEVKAGSGVENNLKIEAGVILESGNKNTNLQLQFSSEQSMGNIKTKQSAGLKINP